MINIFKVVNLTCSYDCQQKTSPIVINASLTLEDGKIYDLSGPSGSGKSSFLKALSKLIHIDSGDIYLNEVNSNGIANSLWRKHVLLFMQQTSLLDLSVRDNILLPFSYEVRKNESMPTEKDMRKILDRLLLEDVSLDDNALELSGGQQARIAFIRNYLTKPNILLLDEVDASLDEVSAEALWSLVDDACDAGASVLRIRHKDSDGRAYKAFTINSQVLSEVR